MAALPKKRIQYGVTEPINFGGNEEYDKECSVSMEKYLAGTGENLRETPEQAMHRETVICTLGELLQTWIRSEYALLGHANADDSDDEEEMLKRKNVYFCTFGSYRLGVNAAGADIDALCVGPRIVNRDRFFGGLVPMLKAHRKISKLLAVTGAYVPVIKLCLDGIEIDLVYACVNMDYVPTTLNLLDDKLLFGLEEVDMRCLNGSRVTDMILSKLIPNRETFRATLVFLKFWAKRRAVHSNVMGFLPGVSIALLCARICQLYPDAEPAYLVHKFFHFYGKIWQWPLPIMLTEVYTHHRSDGSEFEVWDPKKNHLHSRDLMPILTPAFPSMNSTYTVSESTLRIMKRELLRGFAITSSMYPAKGENKCSDLQKVWTELCQPSDFFREYKVYLAVVMESKSTPENHDIWKGFVTSKIRKFVGVLERSYPQVFFHPFPVSSHVEIEHPPLLATETAAITSTTPASASTAITSVTAEASALAPFDPDSPAPPPKTERDTYYVGVEPRAHGQTLYLADSISFFLRMLTMDGQTEDMTANVEVYPAKELRKILKIPPLRKKKTEGVKLEAKEETVKQLESDAQLENEFWPSTDKPDQPPSNGENGDNGDEDMKPKLEEPVKTEASLLKKIPSTPAGSAVKRKKEEVEGAQSPNKRPAAAPSASPSKPAAIDTKSKTPNKPAITIVTSAFKPKPSPKPSPGTPKPLTEQEEKEAKAKRMSEKKQELQRLRQQLAAQPQSAAKSEEALRSPKPAIPKPDFDEAAAATPVKKLEGESAGASNSRDSHIKRARIAVPPGNVPAANSLNSPKVDPLASPKAKTPPSSPTLPAGATAKTKQEKSAQLEQLKQRLAVLQQRKAAEANTTAPPATAKLEAAKLEAPSASSAAVTKLEARSPKVAATPAKQPGATPQKKPPAPKKEPEVIEIE